MVGKKMLVLLIGGAWVGGWGVVDGRCMGGCGVVVMEMLRKYSMGILVLMDAIVAWMGVIFWDCRSSIGWISHWWIGEDSMCKGGRNGLGMWHGGARMIVDTKSWVVAVTEVGWYFEGLVMSGDCGMYRFHCRGFECFCRSNINLSGSIHHEFTTPARFVITTHVVVSNGDFNYPRNLSFFSVELILMDSFSINQTDWWHWPIGNCIPSFLWPILVRPTFIFWRSFFLASPSLLTYLTRHSLASSGE